MADDTQFDPFAGIMTPQKLALARRQAQQAQMEDAQKQDGIGYAARVGGSLLGNAIGQRFGGNTDLDRQAAQNQAILSSSPDVPVGGAQGASPGGPADATQQAQQVDPYEAQAQQYLQKAQQFQQAGNPGLAHQFVTAAQIARQEGTKAAQQRALTAQEQGKAAVEQGKAAVDRSTPYVVVDHAPDSNGIPQYKTFGNNISLYNDDGSINKDFQSQYKQALADAQAKGAAAPTIMRADQLENSKAQVASIRAQASIAAAGIRAQAAAAKNGGELTPEGVATLAVQHLFQGAGALARQDPATRKQVINFEAAHGLSPIDGVSAQAEIKGINAAATKIGGREGNIEILNRSVKGAGQEVLRTLDGVDRGNITAINSILSAGKTYSGSGPEARYAAAIQTFVNEYSRVVSGGTGQSTDSAKAEAHALLNKSQSPEAVKAVIDQLANRETDIVSSAGAGALEYIANPSRYKALKKIQSAAGLPINALLGDPDTPMPGTPSSGQPSGPDAAPTAPAAPTGGSPIKTYDPATGTFK